MRANFFRISFEMNLKTRSLKLLVSVVSILFFASLGLWILGKVGLIGSAGLRELFICSFLYSFLPVSLVMWALLRSTPQESQNNKVFRIKTTLLCLAALLLTVIPTGAFPEYSLAWFMFIPMAIGLAWIPYRFNLLT